MNNDYTKGISKLKIKFFKSDTCLKEENGNLTFIRKLFLDREESQKFINEQRLLFRGYVDLKIREAVGPIVEATVREMSPTLEKVHGDSKKVKYLLTFESYVHNRVQGKEVSHGTKRLSHDC